MTRRATLTCRRCHGALGRIRPETGAVTPLPGVGMRWECAGVLVLTCPACRAERVVTVGEDREAA